MNLDKNLEKKWLVKSENKILGPYSFDQIIDILRKKQISLIDEIRDPETRWLYVRENPLFKNIVEEMRNEIDSRTESTKTFQSSTSKSVEETLFKTKTDFNEFTDVNIEAKEITTTREVFLKPLEKANPQLTEKAKVYGFSTDERIQKKIGVFSNKLLTISVVVFVLALSSVFGYIYIQKRNVIKQEEEWALQIKKYKYLGLYQKAVDVFAKLPAANQRLLIPDLLEIYPLLESTGLVSAEDIKVLKSEAGLSPEQRAKIEIIYFWLAMQQQNYGQAQEYLIKATTLMPLSLLIKENEALLNFKKGQFLTAFNQFKLIFDQEKNGRYLLGMVQSYYGLSSSEKTEFSRDLLMTLERFTAVHYDYKKELLLAQINLANELNEFVLFKLSKNQFFNTPCRLSSKFIKPNLLALNSYGWKELADIKSSAQKTLSGDEKILFQLHDFLEDNKLSEATEFVAGNIAKVGSTAIAVQMNFLLFDAQKRNKDVLAIEKTNQLDMNSELNHLILALNKIEKNKSANLSVHLQFLSSRQLVFYKDWIELEQLISKNSLPELKIFIMDHFVTVDNFSPVFAARNLVN